MVISNIISTQTYRSPSNVALKRSIVLRINPDRVTINQSSSFQFLIYLPLIPPRWLCCPCYECSQVLPPGFGRLVGCWLNWGEPRLKSVSFFLESDENPPTVFSWRNGLQEVAYLGHQLLKKVAITCISITQGGDCCCFTMWCSIHSLDRKSVV